MLFWKVMGYHPYEGGKIDNAFIRGTNCEYMAPEEEEQEDMHLWNLWLKASEEVEQRDYHDPLSF